MNQMEEAFTRANWNKAPAQRTEAPPVPAKKKSTRRGYRKERYSAEFKQRAVDLVRELGSVKKAADALDLHPPTVYSWVFTVEHGGKLEPSAGWVPENGDRFLNPNPGHGSTTHGATHAERLAALEPEIVNPVYERGIKVNEVKCEGVVAAGYSGTGAGGSLPDAHAERREPLENLIMKEAERERANPVPCQSEVEHFLQNKKLRAENEALRQIIRGYQSLLNLM